MSPIAFTGTPFPTGNLPPRSWSTVGWACVAALSVVVTYLITFVLGLGFLGFGMLLLPVVLGKPSLFLIMLTLFSLVVGGTVLWSLVPRKDNFDPRGVQINLASETRLAAEIDAIAQRMGEQSPTELYLISDANAAVAQRGGILGIGSRRVMLIGLPLLQTLTISQFRAIMFHEFAHFYSGDTRLGPWVFKARSNMVRVLNNLGQNSFVLSILRRWAIIALLHAIILGGLVLYWKLFLRLTQYISRRQEYRCDELACYLAGSENFQQGLRNVHLAASTFGLYWNSVVMQIAGTGFHPPIAEGFAKFVSVPAIANLASKMLDVNLAKTTQNQLDSHPPLNARLEKASALAVPVIDHDERPAVALIEDLPSLELRLLRKLATNINTADLKAVAWDSAGSQIYIPLWRKQTALLSATLTGKTVENLPQLLSNLTEIGDRIPDPPGMLLTREQRVDRAVNALSCAMKLCLIDHGWNLHCQPGESFVERGTQQLHTDKVLSDLRLGKMTAAAWTQYCEQNSMQNWPLLSMLA